MDLKYFRLMDLDLCSLGLGSWRLGSRGDQPISVLRKGLAAGINLIDTAESYGKGYSEKLIGEAIKRIPRDQVFLVSKVAQNKDRKELLAAAKAIAARLGTHMDLCLLHAPPWDGSPLPDRIRALEDIVNAGYARFAGVSNFNVAQIKQARQCLNKIDIVAVENELSLQCKRWLFDVVPYAAHEGMLFIAYRPIDTGRLATLHGDLSAVARKYHKTNIQTGLNWLMSIPSVIPIPKAGNLRHLSENLGSLGWMMSSDDLMDLLRSEQL
jgi:diketogulonate reductase-like aldo/keto reductase